MLAHLLQRRARVLAARFLACVACAPRFQVMAAVDCWNVVKMVPEEPRPSSAESGRQRLRNACGA